MANRVVTVNPLPSAGTIAGADSFCNGSFTVLAASAPAGTWSSASPAVTVGSTGIVGAVAPGTGLISYTVVNGCGAASVTKVITVSPLPEAGSIAGTASVCAGDTTVLADYVPGGVWSGGSSATATIGSTGIVLGIAAGIAGMSYTVTNSCGSVTAVRDVTVNPLPVAGIISGPSAVCPGSSIQLFETVAGGSWTSSDPVVAGIDTGGAITGGTTGADLITYTVTNSCGVATATYNVLVKVLPDPGTILNTVFDLCPGASRWLISTIAGGVWTSDNSLIAAINPDGVTGLTPGTTIVSYTVTNDCGSASVAATVTVEPMPAVGMILGQGTICAGNKLLLSDPTLSGVWSCGNPDVAGLDVISPGNASVAGLSAGSATITYSVANSCGIATATANVAVDPLPEAGSITGTTTLPANAVAQLADAVTGGSWTSDHKAIATITQDGTWAAIWPGTTVISYTVQNNCGTAVTTTNVTVEEEKYPFIVYPNPTRGHFILQTPVPGVFVIFTEDGKLLQQWTVEKGRNALTINREVASATYMCRFQR